MANDTVAHDGQNLQSPDILEIKKKLRRVIFELPAIDDKLKNVIEDIHFMHKEIREIYEIILSLHGHDLHSLIS